MKEKDEANIVELVDNARCVISLYRPGSPDEIQDRGAQLAAGWFAHRAGQAARALDDAFRAAWPAVDWETLAKVGKTVPLPRGEWNEDETQEEAEDLKRLLPVLEAHVPVPPKTPQQPGMGDEPPLLARARRNQWWDWTALETLCRRWNVHAVVLRGEVLTSGYAWIDPLEVLLKDDGPAENCITFDPYEDAREVFGKNVCWICPDEYGNVDARTNKDGTKVEETVIWMGKPTTGG